MKPLPHNPDLLDLAPRVIWFVPDPVSRLCDDLRHRDVAVVRRYLDLNDFREVLDHAPPGIIDARSWAYWNTVVGRYPVPPMPRRHIPG
jgi:hypothetical protein